MLAILSARSVCDARFRKKQILQSYVNKIKKTKASLCWTVVREPRKWRSRLHLSSHSDANIHLRTTTNIIYVHFHPVDLWVTRLLISSCELI